MIMQGIGRGLLVGLMTALVLSGPTRGAAPKEEPLFQGRPASYWIKVAAEKNPLTSYQAVGALGALGKDSPEAAAALLQMARGDDATHRRLALGALSKLGPHAAPAIPVAVELLRAPDLESRLAAVQFLGEMGPAARPALPTLFKVLEQDNPPGFSSEILLAVSRIGPGEQAVAEALRRAAREDDNQVRSTAMRSLAQMGPEGGPVLLELLRAGRELDKYTSEALGRSSAEAVLTLTEMAGDVRNPYHAWAMGKLREFGPRARFAAPVAAEAIREERIAIVAAGVLAGIGPGALPELRKALQDKDRAVRNRAVWALSGVGERALPLLIEAVADPENEQVFTHLDPWKAHAKELVPTLIGVLKEPNPNRRLGAIKTLGTMGPAAVAAVPELEKLAATDENPQVRTMAKQLAAGLRAISTKP